VFINSPFDDGGNAKGARIVEQNVQAVIQTHLALEEMGFEPYPEIWYRHEIDKYRDRPTLSAWKAAKAWILKADLFLWIRKDSMPCRDADLRANYAREHKIPMYFSLKELARKVERA
jgi:hypothetical protein